jgi:DICT domain-containing protein
MVQQDITAENMKQLHVHEDVQKQVGMYFDQALDPQTKDEFLQKVNSDPAYYQAFQREQAIRDHLKKNIRRPDNSSQLVKAIKNQIKQP